MCFWLTSQSKVELQLSLIGALEAVKSFSVPGTFYSMCIRGTIAGILQMKPGRQEQEKKLNKLAELMCFLSCLLFCHFSSFYDSLFFPLAVRGDLVTYQKKFIYQYFYFVFFFRLWIELWSSVVTVHQSKKHSQIQTECWENDGKWACVYSHLWRQLKRVWIQANLIISLQSMPPLQCTQQVNKEYSTSAFQTAHSLWLSNMLVTLIYRHYLDLLVITPRLKAYKIFVTKCFT